MYFTDPRLSSNEQALKIVKDLRGGSWGLEVAIESFHLSLEIFQDLDENHRNLIFIILLTLQNNPDHITTY